MGLSNLSVTLLCDSDEGLTPVNSDQVLSDEDLPTTAGSDDSRQVVRIRDVSPDVQIVNVSQVGREWDSRRTVWGAGHPRFESGKRMPLPACVPATATSGWAIDDTPGLASSDPSPVVGTVDVPAVVQVQTIHLSSPPMSGQLSPGSPRKVAFEELGDSSVPLSPNRVQVGRSQEVPEDGVFNVSPVSPGFLMRPLGTAGQHPEAGVLLPSALDGFSDSVLGDPIAFAQCEQIPGSDAPLTFPVYTLPSGLSYMPGQTSVQTVLASGVSSRPEGWSSATAQSAHIAREGAFDASAPPMDTEDSLLVTTGLPGCPYQFTSYNGLAISDMNPAFGLQLHHPRFLEFIGAPESACLLYRSPTFWVDRLGEEQAMAAVDNLQRDAGSNLQILSQFVTSLHRMSSEMLSIGMGRVVFPAEEIADLYPAPLAMRAATYMAAMGLWRPQTGPCDPGPVPASSCNACMNCRYCFPEGRLLPE